MARFVSREAEFQTFASTHTDVIAAVLDGFMLEWVEHRVSFATDSFSNAAFRNWRESRVGSGLWFGPQSQAALDWSDDRQDGGWIHWQAYPWIPDYETVQPDSTAMATPANAYVAGIFSESVRYDVYRFASGGTFELRHVDEQSALAGLGTYSYASETVMHLWAP